MSRNFAMNRREDFTPYLTAVLWEESPQGGDFARRFLHIFEDLFASLEEEVDDIPKLFHPWRTPSRFLPWLAGWVALEIDKEWDELKSRALLDHLVSLYQERGTLPGLQRYLKIYVGANITVEELHEPATEDDNEILANPIHLFRVVINLPKREDSSLRATISRRVREVLDKEKPAHTHFLLKIKHPTMQIREHGFDEHGNVFKTAQIGKDTIISSLL